MNKMFKNEQSEEIIELCTDICRNINQETEYYRASVYKKELQSSIKKKIQELRSLASNLQNDKLMKTFLNFDAISTKSGNSTPNSQCSFISKVQILIEAFQTEIDTLHRSAASPRLFERLNAYPVSYSSQLFINSI